MSTAAALSPTLRSRIEQVAHRIRMMRLVRGAFEKDFRDRHEVELALFEFLVAYERRADEIRKLVARVPIRTPAGDTSATVSMGVTVTSLSRGYTTSDCLQEADLSLYAAKNNGRNRVEVFSALSKHVNAGR